jgi:hypothetical protein
VTRRTAIALFGAGLLLRLSFVALMGMDDMKAYVLWGSKANAQGLASSYSGIYFPLQWQVFQACAWVTSLTGLAYFMVFKAANLVADLALLLLLARLLRDEGQEPRGALRFWCHPTFLMFAVLGYIDGHYALLALLTALLADRATSLGKFAVAGLPLSGAFLMKPQAQSLMIVAFIFAILRYARRKDARPFGLFVAPTLLFVAYTVGLAMGGRSIWALTLTYMETASVMPAMTANQLNFWYPVAYLVEPTRPVYFVADTARVLGSLTIRDLAIALTLSLLGVFAWRLEAARAASTARTEPGTWVLLFAFASLTLPMVMTNAHENHFFLAGLFFVVLWPWARHPAERAALQVLLALSGLNLLGLYGLGMNGLTPVLRPLMAFRTPLLAAAGGAVAGVAFAVAAGFELGLASGRDAHPRFRFGPAAVLLAVLLTVQALTVATLGSPVLAAVFRRP